MQADSVLSRFSLSASPKVASLNIQTGKAKESIFHPQILLDIFLDYSLALLGIPFIWLLYRQWPARFRLFFFAPAIPALAMFFFADNTIMPYKLDLQRMVPYQFWVMVGVLSLFFWKPSWLQSKNLFFILILSNLLAGLIMPKRYQERCWKWYHPEHEYLGKHITSKDMNSETFLIAGLSPGYTGKKSYAFQEDFLINKNNPINDKVREYFNEANSFQLEKLGITHVVYTNDINLDGNYKKELNTKHFSLWTLRHSKNEKSDDL